ncbi:MAG: restriction endonuclease [Flavobacteriales bacterium]|nr:MAG: restriction endonuclease [Flavobacteriales bacterium]
MKSNFDFLKKEFAIFYNRAIKAEQTVITDPRTSLLYSRLALEQAVNWMYANDEDLENQHNTTLHSLLIQPEFKEQFNHKLYQELFVIKNTGNLAAHNKSVSDIDSHNAIDALFYFAKWFAKSYAQNKIGEIGIFDFDLIPKEEGDALSRREIEKLKEQFEKELQSYQEKLQSEKEKNKRLTEENNLHRINSQARIQANKIEATATLDDTVQFPIDEKQTRRFLIDVYLREAGWDLKGVNDKEYKVTYMPKSTNKSETGFVDYVLWDDDGLPLALVEAKKAMESATKGENQAQLYADSLEKMFGRRPVMYYSNGYETFMWDDCFYKQARKVHGFYTKSELQTLMYRRKHRKDIRSMPIDTEIVERFYQIRSIKSIAEHFSGNDKRTGKYIGTNRGALLVLATGTGKTRTSIALSKIMFEANWAKRVLFLADRISLVKQAKANFVKHLPEHSAVNLLEDKDNPDARIAFSTYQTMMSLIDSNRNEEGRFYGVGHFDLVIIDEAHRSIYKKYKAIFDYFDALFLGLTATPKNKIDRNTYSIFGLPDKSPTDAYTFEEAVANEHLVPYKSIPVPTKFSREGIKYEELSEEEKEQFEEEILDGEEATGNEFIASNALNTWLFNKPTAVKTLQYVIKHGIKNRSGEELGKTIIFAKNRKHAYFLRETFLELDKELFGNDYVKVVLHSEPKSQEFIERFCDEEKDRLPQIVISVDMMDTGIDAPSCVNLVFYKPVKSYSKFWQMIGRGSRLRPNLFGEGKDKTHFLIFDMCENFEFFEENPEGIDASTQKSLTEVLFCLRLQLAQYLKSKQFKDNENLQEFRTDLLDGLYKEVSALDLERFDVKMNLKTVHEFNANRELWDNLSKRDVKRIEEELAILVKPRKGDTDLARFYDKLLYGLIKKRLETPNNEHYVEKSTSSITKVVKLSKNLLKKTSIPMVKSLESVIKLPLEESFWKTEGINHLDTIRKELRGLIKYIDPAEQKYVITDFEDELLVDEDMPQIHEPNIEYNTSPFQDNKYRLEKLIRENQNHITISRIRKGETITKTELKALEDILFSDIDKSSVEKELGNKSLDEFIVSLIGLDAETVDKAFADFINDYQLNSIQIEFLDTIKKFITVNGKIEPEKLYKAPFVNFHSQGVDGVFTETQADNIFEILESFSKAN